MKKELIKLAKLASKKVVNNNLHVIHVNKDYTESSDGHVLLREYVSCDVEHFLNPYTLEKITDGEVSYPQTDRVIPQTWERSISMSEIECEYFRSNDKKSSKPMEVVRFDDYIFDSTLLQIAIDFCGQDCIFYMNDKTSPLLVKSEDEKCIAVVMPMMGIYEELYDLYRKGKLECNRKEAKATFIYLVDGKYAFRKKADADKCGGSKIEVVRLD